MACAHKEAVHAVLVEQLYVGSLVYEILIRYREQKAISLELQDELWFRRYRTSWYHAYLRGANPICAEHGVMDYNAFDKKLYKDDPMVVRFRKELGDFASWVAKNPRPEGLPCAAVAFMQGRLDGYVGSWQTHVWNSMRSMVHRRWLKVCRATPT